MAGTGRGLGLRVVVILEASRGARESLSWVWCLIPAWVRVEAWAVVGVFAPEPEGVIAMGAMVLCCLVLWCLDGCC